MLFSGILSQLNQSDGPVTLTGHPDPDYDSAASCLLMRQFLSQCGVEAQICLYGGMDSHSGTALQKYGWNPADLFSPAPAGARLILCDCHTTRLPGRVIACADHHPVMEAPDIPVYLNIPASSAGRIVYLEAMDYGLQADREADFLALSSIYMDTLSCCSSKFQKKDKPWILEIAARRDFDLASLKREGLCLTDMQQPPDILAETGFREYVFGKYRVASSCIQVENADTAPVQILLGQCRQACIAKGYHIWIFLCYAPLAGTTDVYRYERKTETWIREHYDTLLSRGNDVIPALERMLFKQ